MPKKLNLGNDPTPTTVAPNFNDPVFTATAPSVMPSVTVQSVTAVVPAQATQVPAVAAQTSIVIPAKPLTMDEVGRYGLKAQTSTADVTNRIAQTTKTSDMDEVGKLLTDTIMAAKGFDPSNLFKGGFFGFFKAKSAEIAMKFDTVDKTVDRLVMELDKRIALFRGRIHDLEQMAVENKKYHDALTGEIAELRARAEWMEANVPEVDPNDALSATTRQQWLTVAAYAMKRAADLHAAQLLAQQQHAQIGMMADNSASLALTFQDAKVTTIPALKNTFSLYILNLEQKKGAEFANANREMANNAMQANAKLLGQNTTMIQEALTAANITVETLQVNHDAVIHSLNEVQRCRTEMKARIAAEQPKLEQLSADLAKRLAQS